MAPEDSMASIDSFNNTKGVHPIPVELDEVSSQTQSTLCVPVTMVYPLHSRLAYHAGDQLGLLGDFRSNIS